MFLHKIIYLRFQRESVANDLNRHNLTCWYLSSNKAQWSTAYVTMTRNLHYTAKCRRAQRNFFLKDLKTHSVDPVSYFAIVTVVCVILSLKSTTRPAKRLTIGTSCNITIRNVANLGIGKPPSSHPSLFVTLWVEYGVYKAQRWHTTPCINESNYEWKAHLSLHLSPSLSVLSSTGPSLSDLTREDPRNCSVATCVSLSKFSG